MFFNKYFTVTYALRLAIKIELEAIEKKEMT
jgi:hypothetical protein